MADAPLDRPRRPPRDVARRSPTCWSTPSATPRRTAACTSWPRRNPDGALLAVADGCGGIPEADLACVFDTAWRGTRDRGPGPDSGAGLGLAIVRGIVEAHQGQVSVVNTEAGCRFEVRLPALAAQLEAATVLRP